MECDSFAFQFNTVAGWSSQAARQAHNLKVVGSNPTPATNFQGLAATQALFFGLSLDISWTIATLMQDK
jgi:hypothetical protein